MTLLCPKRWCAISGDGGNSVKYYVTYRVDARYVATVEADDLDEARAKAEAEFSDADFGAAEDIDGEDIIVEDERGNFVWGR